MLEREVLLLSESKPTIKIKSLNVRKDVSMRDTNSYDNYQEEGSLELDPRVQEIIRLLEEAILPLSEKPTQPAPVIDGKSEMENDLFPLFEKAEIDEMDEAVLDNTWAALRAEYNQNPAAFLAEFKEDLEDLPEL
jgi:hypothetical protein